MTEWSVCGDCGSAVLDVRLHGAWHRRVERRDAEARLLHDEVEDLRDRVLDRVARVDRRAPAPLEDH